jgi:DNA polymerase-3 subunit delta
LAAAYLVSGDEPLLAAEAAEQIRNAARGRGFTHRDLHVVERGFKWLDLQADAENLSLFADRRVLELRLFSTAIGEAGARTLRALTESPSPERLLLVVCDKLDTGVARSAWVRSIEQHGVHVQVWPVERERLSAWLKARAAGLGLELLGESAELLADRVEGNLLAAVQELEKIALAGGAGRVAEQTVLEAVAANARFDVFRLSDALLGGEPARAVAVLEGLRAEGVEPALVLWAVVREIRLLDRLQFVLRCGQPLDKALMAVGVWQRRQPLVRAALRRFDTRQTARLLCEALQADRSVKGTTGERPWDALERLVLSVTSSMRAPQAA